MKAGTYPIDVSLTNNLVQTLEKPKALSLTVTDKPVILPKFQNVKAENSGTGGKVRFTFSFDTTPSGLVSFKILYGETPTTLTQEIKTLAADSIKKSDGTYTWYIPNLSKKKWYFKILALDGTDTAIEGVSSDVIDVMVDSNATCTIGNITGLTTTTESSKSTLKWDSLTGAMSYNIYKKNADATMTLIQNTKDSSYVIYLSSGSIAYSDFGVKALCADGKTESPDATLASKVQTGPALLLFLAIISGLIALFITRRDYFMMGR